MTGVREGAGMTGVREEAGMTGVRERPAGPADVKEPR